MTSHRPRHVLIGAALATVASGVVWSLALPDGPPSRRYASQLPSGLSSGQFWELITHLSERGGYYASENLVSNEFGYQSVVAAVHRMSGDNPVYLGVGPEQNFTYIAALRPKMAFIVDIRRANLLHHLLYKALFELSSDRQQFLSKLFARPAPKETHASMPIDSLLALYRRVAPDTAMHRRNAGDIRARLVSVHGFPLSAEDMRGITYIHDAFVADGLGISYGYPGPGQGLPTYEDLILESDADGRQHSFLATEDRFQTVRELQLANLILPVVGDFAGTTALRAIGDYLRHQDAGVTVFYVSNVEQYLFREGDYWRRFYDNVAGLPLAPGAVFIRRIGSNVRAEPGSSGMPPRLQTSLLCEIGPFIREYQGRQIRSYLDVIEARC